MNRKLYSIGIPLLLFTLCVSAQQPEVKHFGSRLFQSPAEEPCAHTTMHEKRMATDPQYAQEQLAREESLMQLMTQYEAGALERNDEILTIPVVVHIIHKGEAIGSGSNITDAQIFSAINALNEDFRKMPGTWGDGDGVDVGVEFCLAQRDPNGNEHNGINRVNGCSVTDYCDEGITAGQGQGASETAVKNLSRWPNQQYYNIWVVAEIENNNAGAGIQGYAYFPTTSTVDGTVILYNAFGTEGALKSYTNRNKTLTHELGHAFALFHTFQGGTCSETNCALQGDRVCDTPPTTLNSNCNSPACGGTQQVENYMDYTSQLCKDMFTQGQKDRMRLSIINSRTNLMNSNGCEPVNVVAADAAITEIISPEGSSCNNIIAPVVRLTNVGASPLSSATIEYRTGSGPWQSQAWAGILAQNQGVTVQLPSYDGGWGSRTLQVRAVNPNGGADLNNANNQLNKSYFAVQDGNNLTLTLTIDNLGAQTTWQVVDAADNVMTSGGPYTNFNNGDTYEVPICLPDGCYEFQIFDSGNNGICCFSGNGSYVLNGADNTELAQGSSFGSQDITPFCLESNNAPPAPVADFNAAQTTLCAGGSTNFTSTSTGQIDSYSWQFNGATPPTSMAPNPSNIGWSSPGTYQVQLTVSNAGGSSTETKNNYITVLANQTWYADADGDGHGDGNNSMTACTQPTGFVANADDCDDSNENDWNSCYDCEGVMWGSAYEDDCGVCDDIPDNDCDPCESLEISVESVLNVTCNGGNNGAAVVAVQSLGGNHIVTWSNGATGTAISGLTAGSYTATVLNGTCESSIAIEVTQPDALQIILSNIQDVGCNEENTGQVAISVAGGTPPYTIQALGQTIAQGTYTDLAPGNYIVDVSDANGCTASNIAEIDQVPCDELAITSIVSDQCEQASHSFYDAIHCDPVPGAISYEWEFVSLSENSWLVQTQQPYFVAHDVAEIIPLETYSIRVRGINQNVPSIFGLACELSFNVASTALIAGQCENTELSMDDQLQCNLVEGASQYEFRFEHSITGERSFGYTDASGTLALASVPDLLTEVIYITDVRARYRGIWGSHGNSCNIAIQQLNINPIDTLAPVLPTEFCGNFALDAENDTLELQPINGASVYAIEFRGDSLENPIILESTQPLFEPSNWGVLPKGSTLYLRVRVYLNEAWTPWSNQCSLGFSTTEEEPTDEVPDDETEKYTLNMLLFPNPCLSGQNVGAMMKGDWENVQLTVRNLTGIAMLASQRNFMHEEPQSIELGRLEPGIYLVTAVHGNSTLTKKLIVQ